MNWVVQIFRFSVQITNNDCDRISAKMGACLVWFQLIWAPFFVSKGFLEICIRTFYLKLSTISRRKNGQRQVEIISHLLRKVSIFLALDFHIMVPFSFQDF